MNFLDAPQAQTLGVVDQLRIAGKHPRVMVPGFIVGGFIPLGVFFLTHFLVSQATTLSGLMASVMANPIYWGFITGGLVVSAKTVITWTTTCFSGDRAKAVAFTVFSEGFMSFVHAPMPSGDWHDFSGWAVFIAVNAYSIGTLAVLVGINGVASGCNLVLETRATAKARWENRKPRVEFSGVKVIAPRRARKPKQVSEVISEVSE
ncbi:unnamed protein product [Sphagnum tenellum]